MFTSKRVIFLGTMWRRPFWQSLSYPAESGDVDRSSEVRKLLQMCSSIDAVEDFRSINDNQRIELHRLADEDPRLAMAVATSGEDAQITQTLAGGPWLLQHYVDLSTTHRTAYAALTAAMDAWRIGYRSALPIELFREAIPGYLTPAERALGRGWLEDALTTASREFHGVRALMPVRTDTSIGEANAFVLHDYLSQYNLVERRRILIPTPLWAAAVHTISLSSDLWRVTEQAYNRGLVAYEFELLS